MSTPSRNINRPRLTAPRRREAVVLLAAGRSQNEVASALGVQPRAVSYAVAKVDANPDQLGPLLLTLELPTALAIKLEAAAIRYGRSVDELATTILSIVIADDLFAAVIG